MARNPVRLALKWTIIEFRALDVSGWVDFRRIVDLENEHRGLLSSSAVYLVRMKRPFAFQYEKRPSAVAYIGEGNAKARLSAHFNSWMAVLSGEIPELKIEVCYCEPSIQRSGYICETVEADLLHEFVKLHSELPLMNRRRENKNRRGYVYDRETMNLLKLGSGKGFKYALKPLKSSGLYEASQSQ